MFNTLFTSLTVIFLGIFEQDLRASTLLAVPELYTKGQRSEGFNLKVYLGWMFTAVAEAVIIFYVMWGLYGDAIFSAENSLFPLGNLTFTACVILITAKLQGIEQRYKSIMAAIASVLSVGGWFLWNLILSAVYANNFEYNVKGGFLNRWGRSALWWLTLLLAVTSCLLLEVGLRALKGTFWPTDVEIFQSLEGDGAVRRRFERAAGEFLSLQNDSGVLEEEKEREREVRELLERPRRMEEGGGGDGGELGGIETEEQVVMVGEGRESVEISEILGRRGRGG